MATCAPKSNIKECFKINTFISTRHYLILKQRIHSLVIFSVTRLVINRLARQKNLYNGERERTSQRVKECLGTYMEMRTLS